MATVSRTDLISQTAAAFMRAIQLSYSIKNAKPNTDMYAFFDGISVDRFITPTGGIRGGQVTTNAAGEATGTFTINDFTYSTGTKELKFLDSETYSELSVPGSTVSSATAFFTSNGVVETTQETQTTTNNITQNNTVFRDVRAPRPVPTPPTPIPIVVVQPPPAPSVPPADPARIPVPTPGPLRDPLAQSFFTHGVVGGVNIAKIDIFFSSKDPGSLPITLEIRKLVNGTPTLELADPAARVTVNPADVTVSSTASSPTSFVFGTPIYLQENEDWCFVLLSNSNKYNVWTSKIGEKSIETGKTIFEQPFIGTMFKSENNITWTTDSTEDIKFRIHKAVFSPSATINLTAKANKFYMYGSDMHVTSGSNVITINFNYLHGLRQADIFKITAPTNLASYRGVSSAQMTGLYNITYIDEYTLSIQLPVGSFTSTGTLDFPGLVNEIQVDNGGTGYTVAPTIAVVGTSTTTATAVATVSNGVITGITVTDSGSGYATKPTLTITGTGSGESVFVVSESIFEIQTNRVYDRITPNVETFVPASTSVFSTLKTTSKDYIIGNEQAVELGESIQQKENSIFLSTENNATFLPGQNPTELTMNLSTTSSAVSPIIYVAKPHSLECISYLINNQTEHETVEQTISNRTRKILTEAITAPGSGYTSNAVTVSAPDLSDGTQAVVTATLNSGAVDTVTVSNAGSGYLKPMTITMTEVVGSPAVLTPVLTPFNSELLYTGGTAKSRYFTKPISISTVSSGVVVYVTAYSPAQASFDLYFRSSLKSNASVHVTEPWVMMNCDTTRNLSTRVDEYLDYTFTLNDLSPFDVYDLKIVMRSTKTTQIPSIANYRAIILV